jgi:serine/threonine protein kinase
MATLFLARQSGAAGFTRDVAIKIVNPELATDSQFRAMFLDEARISSRISHPNVVHVEELGEFAGSHYLVMEYVHGCSLSQLQRQLVGRARRLAPAFAARIAVHVAEALHAAHETRGQDGLPLNVVHRDVSPENILLAYAGHVKLIDFGIAKAYGRRHKTQDGLLKGKFRYMAPEQAYGREVDRRTDVYQLGIVLWEMLTLRRLFDAETDTDLLAQVREPRVPPPSALVDRIPPGLDAAVMGALDPDPARRPPDAQTFARMLSRAVPEAHEVDSGALSALVVAAMHEQRQREKTTFPPQVYERLEQQIQTLPQAGASLPPPVLKKYTFEHTSPYGSDSPAGLQQAPRASSSQPAPARHEVTARGSERRVDWQAPAPRERRLVRLAAELRTTITRITASSERRALWLAVGGAIGVAGALALITLAMRTPRVPAPPPAEGVVSAGPAALAPAPGAVMPAAPAPAVDALAPAVSLAGDAGADPLAAPAVIVAPDARRRTTATRERHDDAAPRRGLAQPIEVDGTPLIPAY